MGYTKNRIVINEDIDRVFDVTNQIETWKDLFTEYQESTVLERRGNNITFRLATHPDKDGHVHRWVSERTIDKENYKCEARRLEPLFPFRYMNITWDYKEVKNGTEMTWIQDFRVSPGCAWDEKIFENYINSNSVEQMKVIKEKIEKKLYPVTG